MDRRIEKVLEKLKYPTTEQNLDKTFSALLNTLQSPQALEQVFAVSQIAHQTNFTYVSSMLHEEAPRLLLEYATEIKTPVQFSMLISFRSKLLCKLIDEASRFLILTQETVERLKLRALATEQIREAFHELLSPEDTLSGLITPEVVMQVYQQCTELFEEKTQTELLQLGTLVKPAIEKQFQGLINVGRMPSYFLLKFMRKLARIRIKAQIQELVFVFREEVRVCEANHAMDWDLSAESMKGQLLGSFAKLALSLHTDSAFARTCLARVTSRQYPDLTGTPSSRLRMEAICRLHMGFINFTDPHKICTEPQLYHWLRRIFQALYAYPSESSVYESCFINVLNRSAATYLKEINAFNENLRYTLTDEEFRSRAWQSADLSWATEQLKFRYLSNEPSLSLMLHAPNPGEVDLDMWAGTEHWDMARAVVQWKVSDAPPRQSLSTQALIDVPLALLSSWLMAVPIVVAGLMEFSKSNSENRELHLRRARDLGALLGLLLVHRKLQSRFISLLGHGVGAQVIVCCLAEVAEFNRQVAPEQRFYVLDVILLLGAADAEEVDWTLIMEAVKGRFVNLFSSRDKVVAAAFGPLMIRPIGCSGIGRQEVQDVDVADVLDTQTKGGDPRKQLKQLLKLMNFCP